MEISKPLVIPTNDLIRHLFDGEAIADQFKGIRSLAKGCYFAAGIQLITVGDFLLQLD
jgi:hypothetical protein